MGAAQCALRADQIPTVFVAALQPALLPQVIDAPRRLIDLHADRDRAAQLVVGDAQIIVGCWGCSDMATPRVWCHHVLMIWKMRADAKSFEFVRKTTNS